MTSADCFTWSIRFLDAATFCGGRCSVPATHFAEIASILDALLVPAGLRSILEIEMAPLLYGAVIRNEQGLRAAGVNTIEDGDGFLRGLASALREERVPEHAEAAAKILTHVSRELLRLSSSQHESL